MTISDFGTTQDGQAVQQVMLRGGGLQAKLLTYGAVLRDMRLEGHKPPLVLGLNSVADYQNHSPYFGATAGRCANRVANGAFQIDGNTYQADRNFLGKHMLHGGAKGIGKQVWHLSEYTENTATLTIKLPDMDMGFPGNMVITAQFSLLDTGILDIIYTATTDAPTLCNIAHHSYFNLTGRADLSDHVLSVAADHYLPVDEELIPTGQPADVTGTCYDFRKGQDLGQWDSANLLDHNYCLSSRRKALRQVCELVAPAVTMAVRTTEPGLQVYGGAKINVAAAGLDGALYGANSGVALEPQVWPDAINRPDFPSPILRPDQTYRQQTQYVFTRR